MGTRIGIQPTIDVTQNLLIKDRDLTSPPLVNLVDDKYLVASPATGAWTGHEGDLAVWNGVSWDFYTPQNGWTAEIDDENKYFVFRDTAWTRIDSDAYAPPSVPNFEVEYTDIVKSTVGAASPTTGTTAVINGLIDGLISATGVFTVGPSEAGYWQFDATSDTDSFNGTTAFYLLVAGNFVGTTNEQSVGKHYLTASWAGNLSVGDTVEIRVNKLTGGSVVFRNIRMAGTRNA